MHKFQATEAKQQRDEALNHVQLLTDKLEQVSIGHNGQITIPKDLKGLSIQKLKGLQVSDARNDSFKTFMLILCAFYFSATGQTTI